MSVLASTGSAAPVTLYESFAGNLNFVTAGGTLRTNPDGVDSCSVTTGPVNGAVSGIPAGSGIEAAYLYWAGSGSTPDINVTFNGNNVTADRTFTEQFFLSPNTFDFFGGFKDVTGLVTGNGTYSFSNLTVDNGFPFCPPQGVLSGWALVVIYSNPSEDFRVVNVFDGLQQFRGNSITLIPSNFRIPVAPINGKFAVLSWEGDVGNSAALSGFEEQVRINGNTLTDAVNPVNNQFNSTINSYGAGNNYYGVDVDSYDISAFLMAGDTSLNSFYSSGGDLVLLGAEIVSVTNEPVSDLTLSKTHAGDFVVNTSGVYTITVANAGPDDTVGTTTVVDTLPSGLDYVSATGSGWSCSFSAPDVTCTSTAVVADGGTFPAITLTVAVGDDAFPAVTNSATVTGTNFDNHAPDNTDTDPTTVLGPDLSTSTKAVQDLNGGDANPGDVLRYTITLNNTGAAAASAVVVTDDIPDHVANFTVISIPAGASDASTGSGTGANGTGFLDITGIDVAASGSVQIVYEVEVAGGAQAGDSIQNSADVTSGTVNETLQAAEIIVSVSALPTSGVKALYMDTGTGVTRALPQVNSPSTTFTEIDGGDSLVTWTLAPALAAPLTIDAGNVSVPVYVTRSGNKNTSRSITVELLRGNTVLASQEITRDLGDSDTVPDLVTFTLPLASDQSFTAGQNLRLRITNSTNKNNRRIRVYPRSAQSSDPFDTGLRTRVLLPTATVINVDSVTIHDAAFPGGNVTSSFVPGDTVYFRAVISDPFGFADIDSATIDIADPDGPPLAVSAAAMSRVATTAATATYEYSYTIPGNAPGGPWTATVTGVEGFEQQITHARNQGFTVTEPIGLLAQYLFEDDPFAGTVADSGGRNFDGSAEANVTTRLFEPAYIDAARDLTCRYGRFDGVASGVSAGNVDLGLGGRSAMTVMTWVRWGIPPGDGESWANLVTANENGDTGQFWLQHSSTNNAFQFAVQTGNGRLVINSSVAPVQNLWQHVTGVYDGSALRVYVDGVLAGTASHSGAIRAFNALTELYLGRWKPGDGPRRFNGDLDEVRIHDTALTPAEINVLRETTRPCPAWAPDMLIAKFSTVLSDPVNGSSNPKRIPGAIIQYEILVTNQGPAPPDADSLVIQDALPARIIFAFPDSGDPVTFVDGAASSALTFDYATDVTFSSQAGGGPPFDHSAVDNGDGIDPAVTALRVTPDDEMAASPDEGPAPSFRILFRTRLD